MKTIMMLACLMLGVMSAAPAAVGAATAGGSPAGRWKTIDDSTHQPKSIVRLWEQGGVVTGVIEKVFPEPGKPAHPVCDKCEGALKNKPIEGMIFLWGLQRDDDEWSGGKIVDPANGKIYRCYVKVVDHGRRLKVRGFIGMALFGRTQYWEQVPDEPAPSN